jgi:hypothetical protein
MSEIRPHRTRVEELLEQDGVVSSFPYGEFHMNLEASIKRLEKRAQVVHRCALCSLGIFIICVAFGLLVPFVAHNWIRWIWSGLGLVALFVTGMLAAIDFYKYQPLLKRKHRDEMWAAIDQLQYDVAQLRGQHKEKS